MCFTNTLCPSDVTSPSLKISGNQLQKQRWLPSTFRRLCFVSSPLRLLTCLFSSSPSGGRLILQPLVGITLRNAASGQRRALPLLPLDEGLFRMPPAPLEKPKSSIPTLCHPGLWPPRPGDVTADRRDVMETRMKMLGAQPGGAEQSGQNHAVIGGDFPAQTIFPVSLCFPPFHLILSWGFESKTVVSSPVQWVGQQRGENPTTSKDRTEIKFK